jgi:hypothetical protein
VSPNPDSILDSVKKTLGLDSSDTTFDLDVTLFINSAFGPLNQLGVGPVDGFVIMDNTTLWDEYVSSTSYLGMVKSYIFLKVKMLFDPPESRSAMPAMDKMLEEFVWRINVAAEIAVSVNLSHWWLIANGADFSSQAISGDFGFDPSTKSVYSNGTPTLSPEWWDLTVLSDFPLEAIVGEFGFNSSTGEVWRKTA